MPKYPTKTPPFNPDKFDYPVIGVAVERTGESCYSHKHQKAQLLYGIEGCIEVTANNVLSILTPNKALWIPAGLVHENKIKGKVHYRNLYFDLTYFNDAPTELKVIPVSNLLKEMINHISKLEEKLLSLDTTLRFARCTMDQINHANTLRYTIPISDHPTIKKVMAYLDKNIHRIFTTKEIGDYIGSSTRNLDRIFTAEVGMTVYQWQTQFKLIKALEFLSLGHSVGITSDLLGFANSSTFSLLFKRTLGTSPSKFKG